MVVNETKEKTRILIRIFENIWDNFDISWVIITLLREWLIEDEWINKMIDIFVNTYELIIYQSESKNLQKSIEKLKHIRNVEKNEIESTRLSIDDILEKI